MLCRIGTACCEIDSVEAITTSPLTDGGRGTGNDSTEDEVAGVALGVGAFDGTTPANFGGGVEGLLAITSPS